MKSKFHSFFPVTFIIIILLTALVIQKLRAIDSIDYRGNKTDHMALLAIRNQLIDHHPEGVLNSWNHSLHHCLWEGVICGSKHKRVIELNLHGNGLEGTISPFIGNLSFLRKISLNNNSLYGQIPPEIGHLFRLQSLYLNSNTLTGVIPANISGCINLEDLYVGHNNLHGRLPMGLGALLNLRNLWIQSNFELYGPLFEVITNLTSLEFVDVEYNAFTGAIPTSISRLTNLTTLAVTSNNFSGMIPSSLLNISSLEQLYLAYNQFSGSIPQDILPFRLPRIQIFNLGYNRMSGPFPISLLNLTTLHMMYLGSNSLSGSVRLNFGNFRHLKWLAIGDNNLLGDINFISTLTNCSELQNLQLFRNNFTGILPEVIANLSTTLTWLDVGENPLKGRIPRGIGNLNNLTALFMDATGLTGTIPHDIGKLTNLGRLNFSSNRLTGEIPDSLGNLLLLTELYLDNNEFQGSIPQNLGNCENLLLLYLSHNNFSRSLPNELFGGSAKYIDIDVSHNQLEGFLPIEIEQQTNLIGFYVTGNKLSGEIPDGFANLHALQYLIMNNNKLSGEIPPSLASLVSLVAVDLSQNNLSGPLPDNISQLPLIYLNLSYNDFEGKVPTRGVFANASGIFLNGNNRLCGGIHELNLPRCEEKERKKRRMSRALKLRIVIIAAFIGVLTMATCIWLFLRGRNKNRRSPASLDGTTVNENFLKVSYNMLLKATDGFSVENLLGSGTFGSVFKGILDGKTIAVKVLNLQQRGGSKSFIAECEALRNIRHRNLVGILTACASTDFQRNDFKALVYEFMPNGSVDRWLHEKGNSLSLLQRVDIAIDVAHAINYLHHECGNPIVHCDLKPSNILLDQDMVAHVADFGLAKFIGRPLCPNQSSSINVKGTIGYAAPEYGLGGEASPEADVYSYGILLLELMTRKRPADDMFKEDFNLHMYAKGALPDQVLQIVDSALSENESEEDNDIMEQGMLKKTEECIVIIMTAGVACSNHLPHDRMKISEALNELLKARNVLINPGCKHNLPKGTE